MNRKYYLVINNKSKIYMIITFYKFYATVQIKIDKVTEEVSKQITENAAKKNMAVVVSPVEFSIVANTVSKDGTRSEVTISKFTQYVERTIAIPEGVDPSKITTGVVYNDDGSFAHIPTEIVLKDSKYYARLNSPTNSKYSVIWNPIKVDSVKNHWSKESVEDMASRLVIDNPNSFEPNRAITRGEFIDVVTKGLGIYRPQTEAANKFNDVNKANKFYNGVITGVDYGLINGYKDGSFKPNQKITREEAMAIYAKAMDIAKLEASNKSKLKAYKDSSKISAWAYNSVDKVVASGIFSGKSASQISPKDNITCAEAVVAMRNLLVKGNLINK